MNDSERASADAQESHVCGAASGPVVSGKVGASVAEGGPVACDEVADGGMAGGEVVGVSNALAQKLGIVAILVSPSRAEFTMPVQGNTQVAGVLHGGATAALCENAASAAANAHAKDLHMVAVGTELSIAHLRPGRSGVVTATATAVQLGRRRTVHSVAVHGDAGQLIATALATNALITP